MSAFNPELIHRFEQQPTPFYYYKRGLLQETLSRLMQEANRYSYQVHYALKANTNPELLEIIRQYDLGADCVSGGEVAQAVASGFPADRIVFAGVGKSDAEMKLGLANDIHCFNVESLEELQVLNALAAEMGKTAGIALRINPNVDAYTHHYITTGLEENKFGINMWEMEDLCRQLPALTNIKLLGLHFHIGSQISSLTPFRNLCTKVNEIQHWFEARRMPIAHINVGGGLGIDYHHPDEQAIVDFASYFELFHRFLELRPHQQLHFELGRAIVAQCGSLIARVLFVKKGVSTNFAILDAGMTELIRPMLYQAYHKIENLSANPQGVPYKYDIVGPVCESSDCFAKALLLPETKRGDLIAIRSCGAYGEAMSSSYNLRSKAASYVW